MLFDHPAVKLRQPLWIVPVPAVKVNAGPGCPTGFKEPWVMENCWKSLKNNGLYESTLTLWQFNINVDTFQDVALGADNVKWTQYEACLKLWSEDRLVASSNDVAKTRYIFEGFIPTAVTNLDEIERLKQAGALFGGNLPVCGSQAVVYSLVGALNNALVEHDADPTPSRLETVCLLYTSPSPRD